MEKSLKHYAALSAACFFWGSSFIGSKIALRSFSPLLLCLLRFAVSSAVLIVLRLFRKDFRRPRRQDMKYTLLSGFLGITLYYALENTAVSFTSASDASLISASYPLITILTGIIFFHFRPRRNQLAGLLLAVTGVVILTFVPAESSGTLTGNLILLFAGVLWALYNFITSRISPDCDSFSITYYQILFSTICFLPITAAENTAVGEITLPAVSAVLYLGICCSLLALFLYNYGLRGTDSATAAVMMNLIPVSGVILSAVVLKEALTIRQIIGGLIILAGVMISEKRK